MLHTSHERQQPLVYDLVEPLRPIVDRAILDIFQTHIFSPGDFALLGSGVCRFNPQLAKSVFSEIDCGVGTEQSATQTAAQLVG